MLSFLLSLLSFLIKPNCILEIGTFTGYSALCLAEGLAENGVLHTVEADQEIAFKATQVIKESPLNQKIQVHIGDAMDLIPGLNLSPELIFVDAAKLQYKDYCSLCLPLLKPNGLLMFDNTLWSQKVLDPNMIENDTDTKSMHDFNEYLNSLQGVEILLLPLRDGLTLLRKH